MKKQDKLDAFIGVKVSKELKKELERQNIDIARVCRNALRRAVIK